MAGSDTFPREVQEIVVFDPCSTPYPLEILEWLEADPQPERRMLVMTPRAGVTIILHSEIQDTPARRGQVFRVCKGGGVVAMVTTLHGIGPNRIVAVLTGLV